MAGGLVVTSPPLFPNAGSSTMSSTALGRRAAQARLEPHWRRGCALAPLLQTWRLPLLSQQPTHMSAAAAAPA